MRWINIIIRLIAYDLINVTLLRIFWLIVVIAFVQIILIFFDRKKFVSIDDDFIKLYNWINMFKFIYWNRTLLWNETFTIVSSWIRHDDDDIASTWLVFLKKQQKLRNLSVETCSSVYSLSINKFINCFSFY